MNADDNNDEVATKPQNENEDISNDDDHGDENAKDQAEVEQHQSGSSDSPPEAPPSPNSAQPSAAVDMTGSIRSPISAISKKLAKKRSSRKSSGTMFSSMRQRSSKKVNENKEVVDESLNKQRFRYANNNSNSEEDEWESEMDFSKQSSVDAALSRELTIQQIHDQRAKLAAKNNNANNTQGGAVTQQQSITRTAPPSKTHQLSSSSEKNNNKPSSGSSSMVPGAYSVDLSGRDISIAAAIKGKDEVDSILDNEYASSMMDTEFASSSMRMDITNEFDNNSNSKMMMREIEASVAMQLEAIPVDESLEQAKMQEMEDQMNREIARRLSLERKLSQKERKFINSHHGNGSCIKERIPIIMALVIFCSAIAVGLYFLLLAPNETSQAVESSSNDAFFTFPPPTVEECEAVRNGTAVPNQDQYSTLKMGFVIDVSYDGEAVDDSVDAVLSEIFERYESKVVPTLVGCNDDDEDDILVDGYVNGSTVTRDRYLVANAQILNVTSPSTTSECDTTIQPVPCVRVALDCLFWLKAETRFTDMIVHVQTNFGPTVLKRNTEGGIVTNTKLVSLGPLLQQQDNDDDETTDKKDSYPPPTAEECEAISNGDKVPNQDQYDTMVFDLTLDLSLYPSWDGSIDIVLSEIRDKLESKLVPTVVGCNTVGQEVYSRAPPETQYIFANIIVMDVTKSSLDCHDDPNNDGGDDDSHHPCVQVESRFFVYVKRKLQAFDAISFVHNNFQGILAGSLADGDDIIQKVVLVSAGPAPVQFEFPPPTEEECQAMSNGDPIPGQDQYFTQLADSVIDISTHEHWEDNNLDTVLLEVRNIWQTFIIPTLAGCMDKIDETWINSTKTPERYASINSVVLNVTHVPGECAVAQPRPCLKVGIRTQMWLEREFDFFSMINLIDKNYGPPLMAKVGNREDKSAIIKQAEIVIMTPVFDSLPPSDGLPNPDDDDVSNLDFDFEFPPPTREQCEAMFNGAPVPGQEEYFTMRADTVIDVSTHEPWEDNNNLDTVLLEVRKTWQTIIIPTSAGCMDTLEILRNSSTTVTPDRYAWVNTEVQDVSKVPGSECKATEPTPCVRVSIRTQMWLKKEMNFFDIISAIDRNYGPTLMAKIGNKEDKTAIIKQAEIVIMSPVF